MLGTGSGVLNNKRLLRAHVSLALKFITTLPHALNTASFSYKQVHLCFTLGTATGISRELWHCAAHHHFRHLTGK